MAYAAALSRTLGAISGSSRPLYKCRPTLHNDSGNGTQEAQKAQEGIQIGGSSALLVPLVFFSCASCAPFPICCAKPSAQTNGVHPRARLGPLVPESGWPFA